MGSLNESINEFSIDMYKELSSSGSAENTFISSISIATTLSMLQMGASGNTATQIANVLHYHEPTEERAEPSTGSLAKKPALDISLEQHVQKQTAPMCDQVADVHLKFQALLQNMKSIKDVELTMANGMFAQKKFPFKPQYLKGVQILYQAEMQSVDFEKDNTRKEINKWVEKETKDKIKDLFPPSSLDKNTSMILVNAMYFKGKWTTPFKVEDTSEEPFYVSKDVIKSVPMMHQTAKFNFGPIEKLDAQILQMPYGDGHLIMSILLPNERFGLEKIKKQLSSESINQWTSSENMANQRVDVSLPRFKIEASYDLGPHLINMGMVDAFSQQKANLSGISEIGLYLSKVVHKTFLEVNEEGTEAAAATGAVIVPKMLPPTFIADHPFFLTITEKKNMAIIFAGEFNSPFYSGGSDFPQVKAPKDDPNKIPLVMRMASEVILK
ncbi:serpin B4-like [Pelodytes ibericus]